MLPWWLAVALYVATFPWIKDSYAVIWHTQKAQRHSAAGYHPHQWLSCEDKYLCWSFGMVPSLAV